MQHAFLDKYAHLDSPLHRLDARAKIIGFFVFIIICVTTPPRYYWAFLAYAILLLMLMAVSRLPLKHVLVRLSVVLPFLLAVAIFLPFFKQSGGSYNLGPINVSTGGLLVLWNVAAKSILSVLAVILMSSTTTFPDLLKGLEQLKVPKLLTSLLSFTYRYIFILADEVQRMKRARDSRGWKGHWLWEGKVIGHMIATLFLRSYERGERVYGAMLSRGYDGQARTLHLSTFGVEDFAFVFLLVTVPLAARLFTL